MKAKLLIILIFNLAYFVSSSKAQQGINWLDITAQEEARHRVHLQNYTLGSPNITTWNNGAARFLDINGVNSSSFSTNTTAGYAYTQIGSDKTHTFTLYKFPGNRSEIRVQDDYTTGSRQFEGFVTINNNVFADNAVFQIFGGLLESDGVTQRATLLQIRGDAFSNNGTLRVVHNGTFDVLGSTTIATNILNQEVKINVIHEQQTANTAGKVYIFVNDNLALTLSENFDPNNADNYFKYGCYGREDETSTNGIVNSEVKWRNIRLWSGGRYVPTNTPSPAIPMGLSASIVSPTAANLSWADVSHDTGYTIQVSTTSATTGFSDLTTTNFNVNTFQLTGLTAGVNYWYRVRANGVTNSAFSNAILVNTTNIPFAGASNAIWQYNFGTQAATFTIGAATYTGGAAGSGTNPLTSPGEGQNATIRVNSNANGGFRLVTSGTNFSSGSNGARLAIYPATGGSVNKFYITNIGATNQTPRIATNLFSLSMNVKFVSGTNGTYQLLVGDGAATTAGSSGSNLVNTDPVFAVIRWQPQSNGSYNFATRVGTTGTYNNISGVSLSNGNEFNIRMFCNNTIQALNYTIAGQSYTVAAGTYHLWVNNTRLTTTGGSHNFSATGLPADAKLDFISLIVNNNSNADGEIILDDLRYANFLADLNDPAVLPVSLIGFDARRVSNGVSLNWSTTLESNNARFEIERANDNGVFVKIGEKEGAGNSNRTLTYNFIDNNPLNGNNYYRLKQIDFNGKYEYYGPKVVNYSLENINTSYIYKLSPNEYHAVIHAKRQLQGTISVCNLNGQKVYSQQVVLKEGENIYPISLTGATDGIYLLTLSSQEFINNIKFIKQP
ncbi:fibronectin type III domain-containing protein [Pedobacter puniceum]|uniref:T9SS type A sorting domain-containing protein n=1 Tax=Pedobacter puniceum TaxID=2666136 RepID=A0A7K0FRD6_9SPHI|nr:fibronectin type III domain-containing protein [Pedobacter puniceum]MRX48323.1 T9SS type A sorting domain-containing protein [Pedobacter puniceum]